MGTRLELHDLLIKVLGNENVYFDPPESYKIRYPCIVYERSSSNTIFADNIPYRNKKRYTITVIDKNPDSEISDRLNELPLTLFDRQYSSDNLHHFVSIMYY